MSLWFVEKNQRRTKAATEEVETVDAEIEETEAACRMEADFLRKIFCMESVFLQKEMAEFGASTRP